MTAHNMVDEFDAWFKHNYPKTQAEIEKGTSQDEMEEFRLNCREGWMAAWDRLTQLNAADVPTNGVAAIKTQGKNDHVRRPPAAPVSEPSPDREQVGEAILGSPAFALRGLYKLATEYFIDGKPATPDEYIAWQRGIIEALTNSKIPDPKYYGTQDEDGAQHEVKCAYVDGWNGCRASILAKDASPSRECGERQVAALSDEQARTVECADSWLRMRGLQTYTDLRDTLFAVLRAIGYTEEFAEAHPDLKVSEGVKLFLAASAPTLGERKLRPDEEALFKATVDELLDCNETSTPYQTLLDWANRGLLECAHFEVTVAGNAEIERIERETKSK